MEGQQNNQPQGDENKDVNGAQGEQPNTNEGGDNPTGEAILTWQDQALANARENGREVSSFEELLKPIEIEKEVIKEVNPYDSILDDDDRAYLKYKQETGRGRKEYDSLNVDIEKLDPIVIAREQARREIGVSSLSDELADQFIADKFGFDMDDLSDFDKLKILGYGKTIRDEKKVEQDKYRQPVNNTPPAQQQNSQPQTDYVQLPNGSFMRKEDFESAETTRLKTIEEAKSAVNDVTAVNFKITIDEKGEKKDIDFVYDYDNDDRHGMVSKVSDVNDFITKTFNSENGFNHKDFGEGLQWADPKFREKAHASMAAKVWAQAVEHVMKQNGNHNYTPNQPMNTGTREGVEVRPLMEVFGKR